MSELIVADKWGRASGAHFKKAAPPKLGESFGVWAGREEQLAYLQMPGGAVLQFDLNRLTLSDYRQMRDHYQINISLMLLTFMMHQIEWRIECTDKKIASALEDNLRQVWSRLIRAASVAYWAGRAPTVIQWENGQRYIEISKFKDLVPEECNVNWKQVEGYAPPGQVRPKLNVYDGIKSRGSSFPIPPENTFWYPCLMEHGDYTGKKLLRPAFPPYFFSVLVHLFANRYYERFGEPVPIGRADFEADYDDGNDGLINGRQAMEQILTNLRNRSVVVLPSDRVPVGQGNSTEYTFDIEYLESQMRGADFERYLTRLDEEMSLGLFTPLLMVRTADVGSYNLGVQHAQSYMWMLNALAGDLKDYIDPFITSRWVDFNFGPNAPRATWEFQQMGKENAEAVRSIATALVSAGRAKPDLTELGQAIGMSFTEIKEVVDAPAAPGGDTRDREERPNSAAPRGTNSPRATTKKISGRIRGQVTRSWGKRIQIDPGFRRQFEESLCAEGHSYAAAARMTDDFYSNVQRAVDDMAAVSSTFAGPEQFMEAVDRLLEHEVDGVAA